MENKHATYSPAFHLISWIALIGGIVTCLVVFVIAVGLLVIGLWNATLLLSEKGFYGLAYFLSLFGAVAVQKNVRDVWDPTRLREPLSVTEEGPET